MKNMKESAQSMALLVPVMWLFCGCVDSDHPLSDPKDAELHLELNGRWELQSQDPDTDEYIWDVSPAGKGFPQGMHKLQITRDGEKDSGLFFVSKLGDHFYMNVVQFGGRRLPLKWDEQQVAGYTLLAYRIRKDKLGLIEMDEQFLLAAIRKGTLDGKERSFDSDQAVLASSTSELNTFFSERGEYIHGRVFATMKRRP